MEWDNRRRVCRKPSPRYATSRLPRIEYTSRSVDDSQRTIAQNSSSKTLLHLSNMGTVLHDRLRRKSNWLSCFRDCYDIEWTSGFRSLDGADENAARFQFRKYSRDEQAKASLARLYDG